MQQLTDCLCPRAGEESEEEHTHLGCIYLASTVATSAAWNGAWDWRLELGTAAPEA